MDESKIEGWLTVREASDVSGYAEEYIRKLVRQKDIEAERKTFGWLINRQSLMDYKDKKTQFN